MKYIIGKFISLMHFYYIQSILDVSAYKTYQIPPISHKDYK